MQISSNDIRTELQRFWSGGGWPIITDPVFFLPTIQSVKDFLEKSTTKKLPYIDLLNECEDYALHLVSELRLSRLQAMSDRNLAEDEILNWAFGFCGMARIHGGPTNHIINFAMLEDGDEFDGLYLIEPQVGGIRKAEKGDDEIYLSYM